METDYSTLSQADFEATLLDYDCSPLGRARSHRPTNDSTRRRFRGELWQ